MSLPRFYASELLLGRVDLEPQEAEHAGGARRLRAGDEVEVFDGRGQVGDGLLCVAGRSLAVDVHALRIEARPTIELTVAVAVPKGKRLQMMVEKLTELGVTAIQPVRFERSVAEGGDPVSKWGRWAVEAAKQCHRAWLPEILPLQDFKTFLAAANPAQTLLADATGGAWRELFTGQTQLCCLIGPEGGLTSAEFAACEERAIPRVRLSEHILRIETAALAFCAVASAYVEPVS